MPKQEMKACMKQERENRGFKKQLREKLLKFITRVPVFMYLTAHREATQRDVIAQLEPELFTRVTGLKVSDFEKLCAIGVFNAQVMNSAIFAFKRFEEASLTSAGGKDLDHQVGGRDVAVARQEPSEVVRRSGTMIK